MDALFNFIGEIFGYVMMFFYNIFGNFGVAIIAFTIFTRLLMFPLTIHQQKSMAGMQRLQPKMKELQAKYGNNREKYNEEVQKLYEKEGQNPAGGCLPLLIQLPIFYGLYRAICMPLTCTLHLNITEGTLGTAITRIKSLSDVYTTTSSSYYSQINVIEAVRNIGGNYAKYGFSAAEAEALRPIYEMSHGFNFLGIDLLSIAKFWNPAIILTFVVFFASAGGMFLTNKLNGAAAQAAQPNGFNPNTMGIMMGLMSAWISLSVPSAMALYWTISSLVAPLQSWVVQKYYNAAILNAKAEARRLAKIQLDEDAVIRTVGATKGSRQFSPIYTVPAVESTDEQPKAANAETKKNTGKKKKSSGSQKSQNKKNTSADYQGRKKK